MMSAGMVGLSVFVLSCIIGYYVIWGVTPALHTPLMAVTNAISAIVVVGALIIAGVDETVENASWISGLGFFGVLLAAINIFGGFVVANRMLGMFKQKGKPTQKAGNP